MIAKLERYKEMQNKTKTDFEMLCKRRHFQFLIHVFFAYNICKLLPPGNICLPSMRCWYINLSHMQAVTSQASMRMRAVTPESLLLAHTKGHE